jgi:chemotaxis protein methyltransferase CheR
VVLLTSQPVLDQKSFQAFQSLIFAAAGIHLSDAKRSMVAGRLAKRLKTLELSDYRSYLDFLKSDREEYQLAVNLLTTNETWFFRESKHFDFLRDNILPNFSAGAPCRIWSAACSSGEEPYSLAMMLDDYFGSNSHWQISASDISTQVLNVAGQGHYPLSRAEHIPEAWLKRYCLRGTGDYEGSFLINSKLRSRVNFCQKNLDNLEGFAKHFDVIFLRNVLIYFNPETKRKVVEAVLSQLKPGGVLMVGHSETLNGLSVAVKTLAPSIYRKIG